MHFYDGFGWVFKVKARIVDEGLCKGPFMAIFDLMKDKGGHNRLPNLY